MMRYLAFVALIGFLAAPALADWGHPVKWDQLDPYSSWGGYSTICYDAQWFPQIADDWLCDESEWVTDVHFHGWSYYGSEYVVGFRVSIFSDVPAEPGIDESHPGTLLSTFDVGPEIPGYGGYIEEDPADYLWGINFPEENWFWQEAGTIYWISVQGIMLDDGYQDAYAWMFRDPTVPTNLDDAALWDETLQTWVHWGWFWADDGAGGLELNPGTYVGPEPPIEPFPILDGYAGSADMSFSLTGIPEPASLLLLGLAGVLLRRR